EGSSPSSSQLSSTTWSSFASLMARAFRRVASSAGRISRSGIALGGLLVLLAAALGGQILHLHADLTSRAAAYCASGVALHEALLGDHQHAVGEHVHTE